MYACAHVRFLMYLGSDQDPLYTSTLTSQVRSELEYVYVPVCVCVPVRFM